MKLYRVISRLSALALLLLSINPNAHAGDSYLGFGIGEASSDLRPFFGTYELEDSAMVKGYLGFYFNENMAAEVDLSLGTFDWINSPGNSHTVLNVSASGVAFLPLGDVFELFVKLGANLSSTAVDFQGDVYEGDTGIGATYGGGVLINITEKLGLRIEYQSITGIDDGVDSGDLDWVSAQLQLAL